MRILLDIMSGDHAPGEILRGAVLAKREYDADIIAVGDEAVMRAVATAEGIDLSGIEIVHTTARVTMDDDPLSVVKDKQDSSMSMGLGMLADGKGDAFVSAGNTGALVVGATLIVRKIKGILRAGFPALLPFETPCLLMDSGANIEVNAHQMEQFAYMGAKYMEKVLGVTRPRVGLLNIGEESGKGTETQREAYAYLADSGLNFVGNVEGKDIPRGVCDILVTDGFTGNVLLKYTEGLGAFFAQTLKDLFRTNMRTKIAYKSIEDKVLALKKAFDPSEYGGVPILGIAQPVIKAHGSSNATAIKNAIRQAIAFASCGLNRDIAIYALGYEENARIRAKTRAEIKKLQERAEKQARKMRNGNPAPEGEQNNEE